jgi:phospholipid/cholesterol/gamma-HCH transport system substrate-binding protein
MRRGHVLLGALAGAAIALAIVLLASGNDDAYVLKMRLANAGGLRDGSDVVTGGVKIGQVKLSLDSHDRVEAQLRIKRSHAPVGRDASAAIAAANFLGRKRVELLPGDRRRPAPDGYTLPDSRVKTSTDLDQVLDVLDADTRTRLGVLINEAGAAFTGRRQDFNGLLESLPHSENKARVLLERLVADNSTLANTLTSSDSVVARITAERKNLSRMVGIVGQTAAPLAERRAQLRETLRRAPGTLRTLQGFLGDLERTTVPLGPAARDITATAPLLDQTVAQLDPLRKAADPALHKAVAAAKPLTSLADGATPVLRKAAPVLTQVATLSETAKPVSATLERSVDNLVAVVQNWSRAIQFRDGLSHVFRGEALVSPETLRSLVERLGISLDPKKKTRKAKAAPKRLLTAAPPPAALAPEKPAAKPVLPKIKLPAVDKALDKVKSLVDGITGKPKQEQPQKDQRVAGILDYLLGK